ncbi:hypothetical protein SLS61_007510 [Didymella pomorum]
MAEEASQQVPLRLEELTANNAASELISEKRRPWQEVVADKVAIRDRLVQVHCRSLMAVQVENITSIDDVGDLTERLSVGEFTAEEVTNCLTEICFDDAITQAKRLDDYRKAHNRLMGPLHGVPISLKDQFNVKGFDSTLGYVGRAFNPASSNALVVDFLQSQGAIVLAKTNLPQSIMWGETNNPLWGLTTHPMNPAFTPGGSTGGEGALLAMQGSLVGWGTDIGGSIRLPGHMNGLWAFKPSQDEYYSADGGEDVRTAVLQGGEPFVPQIQKFIDRGPAISVYQYWQVNKRKVAAQHAYLEMWNNMRSASGRPVDILLVPTMAHPAVPHGRVTPWTGYTKLFNLLDYPALSFPAGKVDKTIDIKLEPDYIARNDADAWCQDLYDLETMHGHHIGIQIVGRKFEEEKVLGAAQQIDRLISVPAK